jgi:hypothetical protein
MKHSRIPLRRTKRYFDDFSTVVVVHLCVWFHSCNMQLSHYNFTSVTCKKNASFRQLYLYTRKNAQVVTSLQTSCYKAVHKLSTSCVRSHCLSQVVVTSLKQSVKNL